MPILVGLFVAFVALSLLGDGDPALGFQRVLIGGLIALGIAALYFLQKKLNEAQKARNAEKARLRREEAAKIDAYNAQQRKYSEELAHICESSLKLFENMPTHLTVAEQFLDNAEADFVEGVFAPFWENVEQATRQIGSFDDSVRTMANNSQRYTALVPVYGDRPVPFPLGVESVRAMATANATSARLRSIVRKAQGNIDFAMIYEQWKTNQILIAGFTNLGQALDNMGRRITDSIDGLRDQISEMSAALSETLAELHEQSREASRDLIQSVGELHSAMQDISADQAERHDRALAMLDNIQRRRIPLPRGYGDGTYRS